jgi:hypothetical protein
MDAGLPGESSNGPGSEKNQPQAEGENDLRLKGRLPVKHYDRRVRL